MSATTRSARGLRCSVKRLIVPPLPAASRPSKTTTCLAPVSMRPVLELQQLDLQQVLLDLVAVARHQLVVGVVLAPGLDGLAAGRDEHRVVAVVVAHRVSLGAQLVDVGTQGHLLGHGPIPAPRGARCHPSADPGSGDLTNLPAGEGPGSGVWSGSTQGRSGQTGPTPPRHAGEVTTTTARTHSASTTRPARAVPVHGAAHRPRGRRRPRGAHRCCRSRRRRCSTPPTVRPPGRSAAAGFVAVAALEVVVGWGLYVAAARAGALLRLRGPGQPGWVRRAPRRRGRLGCSGRGATGWPGSAPTGHWPSSCSACTCSSRRSPSGAPTASRRGGGRHRGGRHGVPARRRGRRAAAARRRSRRRAAAARVSSAGWCCSPGWSMVGLGQPGDGG